MTPIQDRQGRSTRSRIFPMPVMRKMSVRLATCLLAFYFTVANATVPEHPAIRYPYKLPPSADLSYSVKVRLYGISLNGSAIMNWRANERRYSLATETRSSFVGKVVEARSEGFINSFGLAPVKMTEKRFSKPPYSAHFDHHNKIISFTATKQTYPIYGGEQDRNSILLQVAAVARGMSKEINKGVEWTFFVVGRRSAQAWTFRVLGKENVETPMGSVPAFHIARLQPENARKQQIELWLAPTLNWYPVRIVFKDKRQNIEQVLTRVEKVEKTVAITGTAFKQKNEREE